MTSPAPIYCDLCGRLLSEPDHDARTCTPTAWERRLLSLVRQWAAEAAALDTRGEDGDRDRAAALRYCIDDVRDAMAQHRRGEPVRDVPARAGRET